MIKKWFDNDQIKKDCINGGWKKVVLAAFYTAALLFVLWILAVAFGN